jgi:hypothetical protein
MSDSLWYLFSETKQQAVNKFNYTYINDDQVKEDYTDGMYVTCFGSYGTAFLKYGVNHRGKETSYNEFYFSLTESVDISIPDPNLLMPRAIHAFNSVFKNIQISILDITRIHRYYDPYYGGISYTEKGKSSLEESNRAKKMMYKGSNVRYLLNIEFDPKYNLFPKYILRTPIGFWIRTFSQYVGTVNMGVVYKEKLNNINSARELIELPFIYCKNNSDSAGYMIADYKPDVDLFYKFDDPDLMNKLFNRPMPKVKFLSGYEALMFNKSIQPSCVYYVIDHDGKTGAEGRSDNYSGFNPKELSIYTLNESNNLN